MKAIDLTGMKYNNLTVIGFSGIRNKSNEKLWECHCECGNTILVRGQDLKSGNTRSCGCLFKFKNHLEGKKFGRLYVLQRVSKDKSCCYYYLCRCDCGNIVKVKGYSLKSGKTKSCGCLNNELRHQRIKHGKYKTRLYKTYLAMKQRCYNNKSKYFNRYGGRGIQICDEWLNSFEAFYEWATNNGYNDTLTIERINNDGNYEPGNCKWITQTEQTYNRCTSKRLTFNGETLTYAQWEKKLGLSPSLISARIRNGWSVERTLSTPVRLHL